MRLRWRFSHLMMLVALAAMLLAGVVWWRRRADPWRPALPPPWVLEYRDPFVVGSVTEVYVHGEDLRAGLNPPRRVFLHYSPQVPGDRARRAFHLLEEPRDGSSTRR